MRAAGRHLGSVGWPVAGFLLVLAAWAWLPGLLSLEAYVVPSPGDTLGALRENWPTIAPLFRRTLFECVTGFAVGVGIGFVAAVVMAHVRFLQRLVYPVLVGSQAVPIVAIAAPLVIVFGFGLTPKLMIVALIVFFPVVVNVLDGLNGVDQDYLNLARSVGARRWRIFLMVKLPATLTPLFSALKLSATYAVTGAVIGEWTASTTPGLGNDITLRNSRLDTAGVWADVLLLTAIGLGGFLLMLLLERLATPWRTRSRARPRRRPATEPAMPQPVTERGGTP
jgi:ABC-type nitrate/sulfonate/bicarbonate transport system permease component